MASWPTLPDSTLAVGDALPAAWTQESASSIAMLQSKTVARLRQTVSQTLTTSTWTALLFDAEDEDTASAHSTSTNTSRFTAPTSGLYLISASASFAANATGSRLIHIRTDGAEVDGARRGVPAFNGLATVVGVTKPIRLIAGHYAEIYAWQSSGGDLATVASDATRPSFDIILLGQ